MARSAVASHVAAGGGGAGVGFAIDRVLEHGDLGLLTFAILAIGAMLFGWLSSRPSKPRRR